MNLLQRALSTAAAILLLAAARLAPQGIPGDMLPDAAGSMDVRVYAVAIDSLVANRAELWHGHVDAISVLDGVLWWPWIKSRKQIEGRLGPVPIGITGGTFGAQHHVVAVARVESRAPTVILGPIDFLSVDDALLRIGIFTGPGSNEVQRVRLRRDGRGWHVVWMGMELST